MAMEDDQIPKWDAREGIIQSAIPEDELERLSDDIIAASRPSMTRKFRRIFSNSA